MSKTPAPFFRSWRYWYLLVLVLLLVEMIFFYLITKLFA